MICDLCRCETYVLYLNDNHLRICCECANMGDLTKNFDRAEFACKCGCGFDAIDTVFAKDLQLAREISNVSYKITSGCRCERHNAIEGGKRNSDHLTGQAADIAVEADTLRFRILKGLILAGFERIGIGKTFIHVGSKDSKNPQEVAWMY